LIIILVLYAIYVIYKDCDDYYVCQKLKEGVKSGYKKMNKLIGKKKPEQIN
jgi:hypothetical protein